MKNRSTLKLIKQTSLGASMADMAMLLLVFFMSTTTTEPPKGAEVQLPKAMVQGAEQDTLYITIAANGSLWLDSQEISLEQLHDSLAMRQGEKDRVVSVTADKNLPYREVAKVLNVLQEREFLNIVFMSESNQAPGGGM